MQLAAQFRTGEEFMEPIVVPDDADFAHWIKEFLFNEPVFPAIKITDSNSTTCIVRKK